MKGGEKMAYTRHRISMDFAVKRLQEDFRDYVQEVYLYGSCARGDQKFRSDVDLLVKVEEGTSPRILRKMRAAVMPETTDLPEVELKFTSGPEFSSSRCFNENIKREGKLIWKRE